MSEHPSEASMETADRIIDRENKDSVSLGQVDLAALIDADKRELAEELRSLIARVDRWNETMEAVIGRHPDYDWGDLTKTREVLDRHQPRQQEDADDAR